MRLLHLSGTDLRATDVVLRQRATGLWVMAVIGVAVGAQMAVASAFAMVPWIIGFPVAAVFGWTGARALSRARRLAHGDAWLAATDGRRVLVRLDSPADPPADHPPRVAELPASAVLGWWDEAVTVPAIGAGPHAHHHAGTARIRSLHLVLDADTAARLRPALRDTTAAFPRATLKGDRLILAWAPNIGKLVPGVEEFVRTLSPTLPRVSGPAA